MKTELQEYFTKNNKIRYFNPRIYEPDFQITLSKGILTFGPGLAAQILAEKFVGAEFAYNAKKLQVIIRLVAESEIEEAGGLPNTPFVLFLKKNPAIEFELAHMLLELGIAPETNQQLTPEILDPAKSILAITLGRVEKRDRPKKKGKMKREGK